MIYHNFLLFKMNISSKIELRQKIEFAENLVLYSRPKNRLLKKIFFSKKKYVLIIPLNISIINIILTKYNQF